MTQMNMNMSQFPMMGLPPNNNNMMTVRNLPTLYVGDLEEQVTEEMLFNWFSKFGYTYSIRVMRDLHNKKSRGFAFVSFYNIKEAENARIHSNHDKILQNPIRVTWKKNIRDMNPEANVFVKNIPSSIDVKTLDSFFSQFGTIFTSKISHDETKEGKGYGYVQFEQKESAEKCLASEEGEDTPDGKIIKINDKSITVCRFMRKKDRSDTRKNLYLKNLPDNLSQDQLESKLMQICEAHGKVSSLLVKVHKDTNKPFAFVCYESNEDADVAYKALQESNQFEGEEQLYVNWAEKKTDRTKKLKEVYSKSVNETNIFTKNLKSTVTKEELVQAFSGFGEITSVLVKEPVVKPDQAKKFDTNTKFGFINFKVKEDARDAVIKAKSTPSICELYHDNQPYLTYHIKKEQYYAYIDARKRTKKPNVPPMMMDPFMFFQNMQGNQRGMRQMPMPFMGQMGNPMMMGGQRGPMMGGQNMRYNNQMGGNRRFNNNNYYNNRRGQNFNRQGYNNNYNNRRPGQGQQQGQQQQGQFQQGQNMMNNMQGQRQNNMPMPNQQQQPQQQASSSLMTPQSLKENLADFLKMDREKQRTILGELLFPLVKQHAEDEVIAPKITGMLIDFEVFDVSDILEFLDSEEQLKGRVQEAEELIKQSTDSEQK